MEIVSYCNGYTELITISENDIIVTYLAHNDVYIGTSYSNDFQVTLIKESKYGLVEMLIKSSIVVIHHGKLVYHKTSYGVFGVRCSVPVTIVNKTIYPEALDPVYYHSSMFHS